MNKYLIILIFTSFVGCGNLYGQELDLIPPEIKISKEDISVDYEEDENSMTLYVDCSYNFPEDYYAVLPSFEVLDKSDSVTWSVDDYSYAWGNEPYIRRYISASDTSGNSSYYYFYVRSSGIKDFSKIILKINDSTFEYDGTTNIATEELSFCEGAIVTMTASVIWDCSPTFEKYEWILSNPYSYFINDSISFNMDTLQNSNEVLLHIGEYPYNFTATFNINKRNNTGVVNKNPPTYPNSSNGSIILSNASNIVWEYKSSTDSSLTDLKPGLYPVKYDYDGCTYEETIDLQSFNRLSFDVISHNGDVVDSIINIYNTDSLMIQNRSTYESGYSWQIGDNIFYDDQDSIWFKPNISEELTIKLFYNNTEIKDTLVKTYKVISVDNIAPKFKIKESLPLTNDLYYESYDEELNLLTLSATDWCSLTIDYDSIDFIQFFAVTDNSDSIILTYTDTDTLGFKYFEAMDTSGNYSSLYVDVTIPSAPGPINSTSLSVNNFVSDGFGDFNFCENEELTLIAYITFGCSQDNAPNEYHWYINDIIFAIGDSIKLSLDTMDFETSVRVKATKTGYSESMHIKIYKIINDSLIEINGPTCSSSADGIIKFNQNVKEIKMLEYNGSDVSFETKYNNLNELYLDSLEAGTYYVSYTVFSGAELDLDCNFSDNIILVPENISGFNLSNTVIDLSKNEILTITNTSTPGGDFSWQVEDTPYFTEDIVFNYPFTSPGTYTIKLYNNIGVCKDTITKQVEVIGNIPVEDKTPPTITFSTQKIKENYSLHGLEFDESNSFIKDDTLHVTLSCKYVFPKDYYFKLENADIEDKNGVLNKIINVDNEIPDDEGYGTVIQTIVAKDNSGNTSKFVIISKVSDSKPGIAVTGMNVGGMKVSFNEETYMLEKIDFEFCENNVDVSLQYSNNGCTGNTNINWFINGELEQTKSDSISVDFSKEGNVIELAAQGDYNNTNSNDSLIISIKRSILDFSIPDTIYLNQNKVLTINNTSTTNAHYHWQIGDKTFINDSTQVHYAFESPGNYEIILTDDSEFCNDTLVKNIIVEVTTSVLDNLIPSIKIGPNPFTDFLNIYLKKSSDYEITIFGVDGRVYLKNQIYDRGDVQLNLSFLHPGIYVLNINSEGNSEPVKDFKIVKLTDN